jgi:DNA-binding winged helix-turn-helix (wHTH) protein
MHAVLLCHSRPLEAFAATALRGSGLTLTAYPHLPALLAAVRSTEPCAVLLQDDHEHLRDSLAALRMNTTQALPVIVIGEGGDSLAHRVRGRIASRRARPNPTSLRAGPCVLHAPTQSISLHDCEVSLTSREFALAWTLFENLGRVVSMRTLSNEIWGRPSDIGKRTIEQHVYKLRRKLGQGRPDSKVVPKIQTVYGVGYRMHL